MNPFLMACAQNRLIYHQFSSCLIAKATCHSPLAYLFYCSRALLLFSQYSSSNIWLTFQISLLLSFSESRRIAMTPLHPQESQWMQKNACFCWLASENLDYTTEYLPQLVIVQNNKHSASVARVWCYRNLIITIITITRRASSP